MSELNEKAYVIIDKIDSYIKDMSLTCSELRQKLSLAEQKLEMAQNNAHGSHVQVLELETKVSLFEKTNKELTERLKSQADELTNVKMNSIQPDKSISDKQLQEKIHALEENVKFWEEKYKTTYRILQSEMVKMDTMQMELELAQKERDISLRRNSITPEQKQILVKLEHESYKINEAIERIDFISSSLKKLFNVQNDKVNEEC